jgi:hypothetical protein
MVVTPLQPKPGHQGKDRGGKAPGQKKYPERPLAARAAFTKDWNCVNAPENCERVVHGFSFPAHAERDAEYQQGEKAEVLQKVFRPFTKASH